MLPDFSNTRELVNEKLKAAFQKTQQDRSVVMRQVKKFSIPEGDGTAAIDDSGGVHPQKMERVSATIEFRTEEMDTLSMEQCIQRYNQTAEQFVEQQSKIFYKAMDEWSKESKNISKSTEPLTIDSWFGLLEKMDINFDHNGRYILPGVITGSKEDAERMNRELMTAQNEPAFVERFKLLIQKKKDEYHDREANRKLVK